MCELCLPQTIYSLDYHIGDVTKHIVANSKANKIMLGTKENESMLVWKAIITLWYRCARGDCQSVQFWSRKCIGLGFVPYNLSKDTFSSLFNLCGPRILEPLVPVYLFAIRLKITEQIDKCWMGFGNCHQACSFSTSRSGPGWSWPIPCRDCWISFQSVSLRIILHYYDNSWLLLAF